jgi:hypothetical protein
MHGHTNVKNRNMLSLYYIYYFREKSSAGVWVGLIRTCDAYKTEPVPVGLQEGPCQLTKNAVRTGSSSQHFTPRPRFGTDQITTS